MANQIIPQITSQLLAKLNDASLSTEEKKLVLETWIEARKLDVEEKKLNQAHEIETQKSSLKPRSLSLKPRSLSFKRLSFGPIKLVWGLDFSSLQGFLWLLECFQSFWKSSSSLSSLYHGDGFWGVLFMATY